ncbi:hypothetical protein ACWD62_41540 [Streptomyces sp. NPDC005146]
MGFDGPLGNAQAAGDRVVCPAGREKEKDLVFALGQLRNSLGGRLQVRKTLILVGVCKGDISVHGHSQSSTRIYGGSAR